MTTAPLSNPSAFGAEYKAPIYSDLVSAKLGFGDITSAVDLGLGVLGAALDPIGAILGSAVDYLMNLIVNNISFLKKAVDDLLGDPPGITKVAMAWSQAGQDIATSANRHVGYISELETWTGDAATAYRDVVRGTHGVYQTASVAAADISGWVGIAGSVVSVFREFVWGMLKDFITQVIEAAIAALAAAIPSLGSSIGVFTAWFTGKIGVMAGKFAKTLSKLMSKMGAMARKLGKSGAAFDTAAQRLSDVAGKMGRAASRNFGRSGIQPNPRMPGENTDPFNRAFPGFEGGKKAYRNTKNVTNATDSGAHNTQDGNSVPIDDLPAGY
jgi:uncharacterized protein YukE